MNVERGLVKTDLGYLHYLATGTPGSEAIFLQHINQQSSALYLELMAVLAPMLRVVAMDYPSHGDSDHVDVQPTIGDYARCVVAVADALNIPTSRHSACSARPSARRCRLSWRRIMRRA